MGNMTFVFMLENMFDFKQSIQNLNSFKKKKNGLTI